MDKNVVKIAAIIAGVAILSIIIFNIIISPPKLKGSRDVLYKSKTTQLNGGVAPESITFDPNGGGPYTGVEDGRVLKWESTSVGWTDFAVTSSTRKYCGNPNQPALEHVCGRPLGVHFENKSGDLYIADCYFGLMVVGPAGGLATSVLKEVERRPLHFTNHMDIDEHEDVIYFTDSSIYYRIRTYMHMLLTQDNTGRLIRYDKSSKEAKEILRGLKFPNGVALSKDQSYVLVAESTTCLVHRVWLKGHNAGKHDIFAELPGFPDNIRRNSKGEFWIALHAKKGFYSKVALSSPLIGKALLKIFSFDTLEYFLQGGKPHAVAIKLSDSGKILEILEDSEGKTLRYISETYEKDGKLWFGSIAEPFIGIYDLKQ